jgi:hypothetical protein
MRRTPACAGRPPCGHAKNVEMSDVGEWLDFDAVQERFKRRPETGKKVIDQGETMEHPILGKLWRVPCLRDARTTGEENTEDRVERAERPGPYLWQVTPPKRDGRADGQRQAAGRPRKRPDPRADGPTAGDQHRQTDKLTGSLADGPEKTRRDQTRPDQTRPDQTGPDQTRPDQTRPDGRRD